MNEQTELNKLKKLNDRLENQLAHTFNLLNIAREISHFTSIQDFFKTLLELFVIILGSKRHSLILVNNNSLKIIASRHEDDYVELEQFVLNEGVFKKVIESKEIYISSGLEQSSKDDVIACIPLIFDNEVIGLIVVYELLSHKPCFTEADIDAFDLISTIGGHNLMAVQKCQKAKSEAESKDVTISKLYEMSTLITSMVDITKVLKVVLGTIDELLKPDVINIFIYDKSNDCIVLRQSKNCDKEIVFNYKLEIGDGISGKVFETLDSVLIKDMTQDVRSSELLNTKEAIFYKGSLICVPIIVRNKAIGVMTISKESTLSPLNVSDKKLLTTLASQTAIAIDNAYMYEKQENDLIKVSNFFIAASQLHSTLEILEVYRIVKSLMIDFIGVESFSLMLKNVDNPNLRIVLSNGISPELENKPIPIKDDIIGHTVINGDPFYALTEDDTPVLTFEGYYLSVVACIPLSFESKIAGALVVHKFSGDKKKLIESDIALLDILAQHTAVAIFYAKSFAGPVEKFDDSYNIFEAISQSTNLDKSLKSTLILLHTNIQGLKSVVLIYDEKKQKYYQVVSFKYTASELVDFTMKHKRNTAMISLYSGRKEIGVLFVEKENLEPFSKSEKEILSTAATLISEIIQNERNLKQSRSLSKLLTEEKQHLNAAITNISDGIVIVDLKFSVMMVNSHLEKLFNLSALNAVGMDIDDIFENTKLTNILKKSLDDNKTYSDRMVLEYKDACKEIEIRTSCIMDELNKPLGVIAFFHEFIQGEDKISDDDAALLHKFQKLSTTDFLTNLPNRRYFNKRIEEEFLRSRRYGTKFSIAIAEIDDSNKLIESHGDETFDQIIIFVTEILTGYVRNVDILTRFSRKKFGIIFPETLADKAYFCMERVRTAIKEKNFEFNNKNLSLSLSSGIYSDKTKEATSYEEIINFASQSLHNAKKSGGDKNIISVT